MSIFQDMWEQKHFPSPHEYRELPRMLSEAIERGFVQEIPNRWKGIGRRVRWFREKGTDVVYALEERGDHSIGTWWELEPEELLPGTPMSSLTN